MKHSILACGVATLSALALACGEKASTPASPSSLPTETAAASATDGSTLKSTAPAPYSPANASVVASLAPNLVVSNATLVQLGDVSTAAMLNYRFVVETTAGAAVANMTAVPSGGAYAALGITGARVPENLLRPDTTYRWRARAELGSAVGPWSGYWTLKTPAPKPAPAPRTGTGAYTLPGPDRRALAQDTDGHRRLRRGEVSAVPQGHQHPARPRGQHGVHPRPHD